MHTIHQPPVKTAVRPLRAELADLAIEKVWVVRCYAVARLRAA